jgi:deoxyribodipyrimidine photo-lyase
MRALYLFRNDLRLADNPGVMSLAGADALLCVYCWPSVPAWCNLNGLGAQRARFLRESLLALHQDLQELGQGLLVMHTGPRSALPHLVEHFGIERVATSAAAGVYEREQITHLVKTLKIPIDIFEVGTLFSEQELPGSLANLPRQFTPFRRHVETLSVNEPLPPPQQLAPAPAGAKFEAISESTVSPHPAFPIRGGSDEGHRRIRHWLIERRRAADYADTRNYLDGMDGSSVFSPWLATGALSPRQVANALFDFELREVRNASTRHLYQELLWREFFHWRAAVDGARLFSATGISGKKQLRTFEARDFARWCDGTTDNALVNALMHQLVATGWMTNRGRQIAASYLVNELNHDWRYGAAFFEKHLIDFDVGSNYGNWQYIAGVGTDPRGGRHFNLAKQAALYDPEGTFTAKWDGHQPQQPRYINDAADWPLEDPESTPGGEL